VANHYAGDAADGEVFGYFYATVESHILGLDVSCRTAPAGSDAVVGVRVNGALHYSQITIPAGERNAHRLFASGIDLATGDEVEIEIVASGDTTPASYLLVNLILGRGGYSAIALPANVILDSDGDYILDSDGNFIAFT
jgi:hypothetical protein